MGKDWTLNHLGLMVSNKDILLKYFQSLGIGLSVGPQPLLPHEEGEGELTYYRSLEGDPVSSRYLTGGAHNFRDGNSQIGDCQLEVYPMKPGPGMFISEYLEQKGPGINHIAFNTPDIQRDTETLLNKGCDLVFNATVNGRTVENYIDTRKFGDVMISLRPLADNWEKAWRENNKVHPLVSNWKFLGVGIAVENLENSSNYYNDLSFCEASALLESNQLNQHSRSFRVGPISFELIEPLEKVNIYKESLEVRGEGIADLTFLVDNLNLEVEKLVSNGVGLLLKQDTGPSHFALLDTRKEGNLITRLIQQ